MPYTSDHGFVPRSAMRLFALAATVSALMAPASVLAAGQDGQPSHGTCVQVSDIDHTQVLNNRQILFFLHGKKVLVNNLAYPCPTLAVQDGFVWSSAFPEYCDNVESIRVLRTGEVCQLGAFTPYEKPVSHS